MNIQMQLLCGHIFSLLLGRYPGVEIMGCVGRVFIRKCQTLLQSGGTILHCHQRCESSSCSTSPSTLGIVSDSALLIIVF